MEELITRADLPSYYIHYSSVHLLRLERQGKFPKRVSLGDGRRVYWVKREIEEFVRDKLARRGDIALTRTPAEGGLQSSQE